MSHAALGQPHPEGVASTFSARLRAATAEAHRRTERAFGFAQIIDGTLSLEIYRALLRRLHAIYTPAERQIVAFTDHVTPAYQYGCKLDRLATDLEVLGITPGHREYRWRVGGSERSAAMLYVVEGATLGGKILSARVHALLGEQGSRATGFFDPYGAACGSNWRHTRQVLDDLVYAGRLDEAGVIAEAVDIFTWFGACLDEDP